MFEATCLAGLYILAIYWVNKVTHMESERVIKHVHDIEGKLDRLLEVLDESEEQSAEILGSLSVCEKEEN